MVSGTQILYRSPPDPSVWYAPETLLWYAVLLGGPLLVVIALKPLIFGLLDGLAGRAPGEQPTDLDATQRPMLLALPGVRATALLFCYAVMVFNACVGATWMLAERVPDGDAVLVNTSPGLSAAAAFLTPFAACIFVTTLATLAVVPRCAAALPGTDLISVIRIFAAAAGCIAAAFLAAIAGPYASLPWVALGLGLLGYGVWLRQARSSYGEPSIGERAGRAEQLAQREQAQAVVATAPSKGEYRGRSPFRYWSKITGMFLLPLVFFVGSFAVFDRSFQAAREFLSEPMFIVFSLFAGCFFASLTWLTTTRHARQANWDEDSIQVSWYRGRPKAFRWDQLVSLKVLEVQKGVKGALVKTMTGEKFNICVGDPGYESLLAALEAHIWTRDTPATSA